MKSLNWVNIVMNFPFVCVMSTFIVWRDCRENDINFSCLYAYRVYILKSNLNHLNLVVKWKLTTTSNEQISNKYYITSCNVICCMLFIYIKDYTSTYEKYQN